MSSRPLIVGTAGHIDHGKTSLIRALTGVNLDRLPEEQERGITIALGFTQLSLGENGQAAFVDVPGHEKLVRTMIAGATGLDAVILVVAANEGVMPQTREHLDILHLLGVEHGLIVLSKCDLVDEETLELAEMDVMDAVSGTFLDNAPILPTQLGDELAGLEAVRDAIKAIADNPERLRDQTTCFRLPIDRAFVQKGFGTVVTGTASGAGLSDGAQVWIQPIGISSRIRGLQVHGREVDRVAAGQRVAANLAGVERDDLQRGMVVVAQEALQPASILDVRLEMLPHAPRIPAGSHVRLLCGTAEVLAIAEPIGHDALEPDATQFIQLRTETPVIALPSDRFIIRRESPLETLGGGVILDPWAARTRRKHHDAILSDLTALASGDSAPLLRRAGPGGLTFEQAKVRGNLTGIDLGDRRIHSDHVQALREHLEAALSTWHSSHPLEPGAPRRALHTGPLAALTDRAFDALIAYLVEGEVIVAEGPFIRMSDFTIALSPEQDAARANMVTALTEAGLEGQPFNELIKDTEGLLQLLIAQGTAVRIGDRVVLANALNELTRKVSDYFEANQRLSPADFKAMTKLSRRTAIPLMEWLDEQGVTRRDGDARVAG